MSKQIEITEDTQVTIILTGSIAAFRFIADAVGERPYRTAKPIIEALDAAVTKGIEDIKSQSKQEAQPFGEGAQ